MGSVRFVRVPPYESGVKLTNFSFSWQNGDFFWSQKCCTHFLTQNEELSKKNWRVYMCLQSRVRKYVTGGGTSAPPPWIGLKDVSAVSWFVYHLKRKRLLQKLVEININSLRRLFVDVQSNTKRLVSAVNCNCNIFRRRLPQKSTTML